MIEFDSSAFNETAKKQIEKYMDKIHNITPENISLIPISTIETTQPVTYNKYYEDVDWNYNSNVNSIEMSKFSQAINYLKTYKTQLSYSSQTINPRIEYLDTFDYNNIGYIKCRYQIPIPEGYDGRNSFVAYSIRCLVTKDTKGFHTVIPIQTFISEYINKFPGQRVGINIVKNEKNVTLDMRYPYEDTNLFTKDSIRIRLNSVFWRYV